MFGKWTKGVRTGLAAAVAAFAATYASAEAGLPVSRAPFARAGARRQPVRMEVKPFSYGTNLWDGVEFVSGSKRLIVSGADRSIDCNNPLRFGRLFLMNGRRLEASLGLTAGSIWSAQARPGDALTVEPAANRAVWRRRWVRPDGRPAVFSYAVTGREDGTATIDWDMGLTLEEACAQTNRLGIGSTFSICGDVAPEASFGFGDRPHDMYPREKLLEAKKAQIHFPLPNPQETVFHFERRDALRHWSLAFPASWVRQMHVFDFAGTERDGRVLRGTTYHYGVDDFRRGNPSGFAVKGRLTLDFGKNSLPRVAPAPAVGGLDFWGFDAVHVPAPPTRNLLLNGSFEQDLKGWRWEDWGAAYTPAEKPNEEVVAGGRFGRHALALRGTQPACPALCSAPMALVAGKTYTASCWLKAFGTRQMTVGLRMRSVSRNGKYWQFRGMGDFPHARPAPGGGWTRHAVTFTADGGGFYVQLQARGSLDPADGVLVDGVQVEEGAAPTDFAEAPFVANLLTSEPCNDLRPGDPLDARLDVQAARPGTAGRVKVTVRNGYFEEVFARAYPLAGDAVLPLDLDAAKLGTGLFVVRMDYAVTGGGRPGEAARWTDYARFSVQRPLANAHATAQFYANHAWYERVPLAPRYVRKFVEWGWGATDGRGVGLDAPVRALVKKAGIRNYVHPVAYERQTLASVATNLPSGGVLEGGFDFRSWTEVTPRRLEFLEAAAHRLGLACDPQDDIWTWWNEEESWARKVGYDAHFRCVEACMRGLRRAFAARGLPPPRFSESHGTSHYFNGRNYDAIDGYLAAAARKGVTYDVVTIHPYQNIDGGTLGGKDADLETQHLIRQMKEHGYPDDTPILFTECFNMHPVRIPPWGADGWGDSYRANTQPSQDLGNREFLMAASQMRLYLIALKFWPKVRLVHPWNATPILDARFTPCAFTFSANTLGHLLPAPEFVGDAQPYGDVRGYCFRQKEADGKGGRAVMAVWTTNHDVEWGVRESPVVQMALPPDTAFIDMFGNRREAPAPGAASLSRVPLTPAPLFLVSRDAEGLLRALREAVAEDPSTALSPDVRPDGEGRVNLVLQNETKARQAGTVTAGERTFAYDLPPRGRQTLQIAQGETTPMKLQAWTGALSILPRPWDVKWFFVPRCGARPDWDRIPAQPLLTERLPRGQTGRMRLAASCKLAWNPDFLFVRVEAEDPEFVPAGRDGAPFDPCALYAHDGCLEVAFDGFGDARAQGAKGYDLDDSRYDFLGRDVHRFRAVNWQLAQGTVSATDEEVKENLVRTFTRTEKGYVYEIAFAARYMAPVDLRPGTVAGVGISLHDWNGTGGRRTHATLSNATVPGMDCDGKPHLWPLMVLGGEGEK